eukprot:6185877-Pleurochrysis_carterae.AAC.1
MIDHNGECKIRDEVFSARFSDLQRKQAIQRDKGGVPWLACERVRVDDGGAPKDGARVSVVDLGAQFDAVAVCSKRGESVGKRKFGTRSERHSEKLEKQVLGKKAENVLK